MIDAVGYGKALFQLAEENRNEEEVREQLTLVCEAVRRCPEYTTLLDTPAVPTEEKLGLLRQAFGSMDAMLVNFLCLLCEKRSFYQLPACNEAFRSCFDEAHGILRATALTAVPMDEAQIRALEAKLGKLTGKNVCLENRVDESLLGGVQLRYGGVQLDDTLRSGLERFRRALADTIV